MTFLPRLITCLTLTFAVSLTACDSDTDEGSETKADSSGTSSSGDGDGDVTTSGGESEESGADDSSCPLGSFDCPCNDGTCEAGLECTVDGVCALDGSGGSGTPSTSGGPSTTASPGDPDLYDPEECEAPSEILSVEDVDGEFCSAPCVLDEDCPDGPNGTTAACTISTIGGEPNHCTLLCTPMPDGEECDDGATCKPVPQQPNFGLCTYP